MAKDGEKYILVTGAAGYIGSVVTEKLLEEGRRIIALDNLTQGHREAVAEGALFVRGDLQDAGLLDNLFRDHPVDAVVHFAARTLVGESVTDPAPYFQNNLVYGLNLLNAMIKHRVNKLVFSSSCAVYGDPRGKTISEKTPKNPINPYGEAKLAFEKMLKWYAGSYGLSSVSLRYFNAAGATRRFGEHHEPETHLIPNVLRAALGRTKNITLFGSDYPTRDGSCVRDYVHVIDIARAHMLALDRLDMTGLCRAYNLGNGEGYSVLEIIDVTGKVTGAEIPVVVSERRPGDPPVLVADAALAKAELGWTPACAKIEDIIESAYKWMLDHPGGYG